MRVSELLARYDAARQEAAGLPTWRLRLRARRLRQELWADPDSSVRQVRQIAVEHELVNRGVQAAPVFIRRTGPPPRPGPLGRLRRWVRR
jgi:hypothetical protein